MLYGYIPYLISEYILLLIDLRLSYISLVEPYIILIWYIIILIRLQIFLVLMCPIPITLPLSTISKMVK